MIDCDVHNELVSADDLAPYLTPYYREYLERGERPGGKGSMPRATRAWLHPENYSRVDAIPSDGRPAGSDYDLLREQLLDAYELDIAVLTGDSIIEISTLANRYYASALARAHNDYVVEHWLPRDDRLRSSLAVAPQDPAGAAEEIRRLGAHQGMVQVLVSSGAQKPYGDPFYHSIWDAAAEVGLPIAIHLGGNAGINVNPTGCGSPTFFWEYHAMACETGMGHLASMIAHGVFERWPNLRIIFMELGVAWLPAVVWRLDADYKALRKETPWLKRLPSEYAMEHARFTTQPLEIPAGVPEFWEVLEDLNGRELLMYASDYPHWDFDDPRTVAIPEDWRSRVFDDNARTTFGFCTPSPTAPGARC